MRTWRLAVVLGALALLGCPADSLEGGRYACVIGGPEDQCPGNWRCGLEETCHALGDTTRAWKCVTGENCENGFQCGLNELRDGGECHDPQVAQPYACLDTAQCSGGWHCGVAGRCYDRSVPADIACRFDAGDCAANWRCGLEGRCQNQDAGAAYHCRTDAGLDDRWCEQGWRCAPEGSCTDPREEALIEVSLQPPSATAKIHPLVEHDIERFTVSQVYDAGFGAGQQTVAYIEGGQLKARLFTGSPDAPERGYALGNWASGVAFVALGSRGEHDEFPYIIEDDLPRVLAVRSDGGVETWTLLEDGGVLNDRVNADHPVEKLRVGSVFGEVSPRVLGFTGAPDFYTRLMGGPDTSQFNEDFREDTNGQRFDLAVPNNHLYEMAAVRPSLEVECVFAVDNRGLWVAQRSLDLASNFAFSPLELPLFPNERCRSVAPLRHRITRLTPTGRDWLGFSSQGPDGGTNIGIFDLRAFYTRQFSDVLCAPEIDQACTTADRVPIEQRMGPCPVCIGGTLLDFAVVTDSNQQPSVQVRCGGPDGGTSGFFTFSPRLSGTECDRAISEGESGVFSKQPLLSAESTTPGQVAWASPDGFLWRGTSSQTLVSDLFDRVPTALARHTASAADVLVFTSDLAASFVPGVGLVSRPESVVVSAVSRAPEWIITHKRLVVDLSDASSKGEQIGLVGNAMNTFDPPYRAMLARNATAKVLVVSAGSSVFSGEMDATLAHLQSYAPLTLKVVGPSQIDSIAFPELAVAGLYLQGYAVTPNGVLRLTAQNANQWGFEAISLPVSLVPREVWFEKTRGRVGFADGSVYALPSRVPLAPPIEDGVVDYEQACDQQFALGNAKLFRLDATPGKSVGHWTSIALPAGFEGDLSGGRIHGLGSALYVFKRSGETARLDFANCPVSP